MVPRPTIAQTLPDAAPAPKRRDVWILGYLTPRDRGAEPGGAAGKILGLVEGGERRAVSSVLAPQGARSYGPENLARWTGDATRAWCEGAAGPGAGETVTVRVVQRRAKVGHLMG